MKILSSLAVAAMVLFASVPANAGNNNDDVIIGVLGGALGGLIVGEIIGNNNSNRNNGNNVYIYQQPAPRRIPVCYDRWYTVWDPYINQYVQVQKTICD